MRVVVLLMLIATGLVPTSARALILLQEARLPASVEYDSNPIMRSTDAQSVWRYTLNPNYKVVAKNELSTWNLNAGLRYQQSSDTTVSVDREDPSLGLGWQREFERSSLGATVNYVQTTTRITEFDETGTGLVQKDGTSKTRSARINGSHQFTERLSGSAGVDYRRLVFTESDLRNYSSTGYNLGLTYLYNERVSPYIQFSWNDFKPQGGFGVRSTSKNLMVGANLLITPQLTSGFGVGMNQTSLAGNGWIANASMNYDNNYHHYVANYVRSVNATGAGGFQESDRVTFQYSYDFTEKSKLGIDYSLIKNKSINDAETQRLTGWYSRELSDNWDLRFRVERKELKSANRSADANVINITFSYRWAEF